MSIQATWASTGYIISNANETFALPRPNIDLTNSDITFIKNRGGYIINTEKDSLDKVCILIKNQENLLYKTETEFSEIQRLKQNSVSFFCSV